VFWYDSHGTILDDRTLLTHHHYLILEDASCTLRAAVFYNSAGHVIKTISDPAHLAKIEGQLRSQGEACHGEFCILALAEPSFTSPRGIHFACPECEWLAEDIAYLPEVAVINWEGYPGSTYVQWTRLEGFSTRSDVPVLEVTAGILKGASGGGAWIVTADGMTHIGNSWRRAVDGSGSVVALNPAKMN
jgi:hypothetical protein